MSADGTFAPLMDTVQQAFIDIPMLKLSLFLLLPSDNVQHDLQHGSLITFPKEENLGNKRKPMHRVYLPSVPTFGSNYYISEERLTRQT